MAITITQVSNITSDEFDTFWNYSLPYMTAETNPTILTSSSHGIPLSTSKEAIKDTYFGGSYNCYKISKDGTLVGIASGASDNGFLFAPCALTGPDSSNSRAWKYTTDYWSAWRTVVSAANLSGLKSKVIGTTHSAIVDNGQNNRYPDSTFTTSVSETLPNGDSINIITFTHN